MRVQFGEITFDSDTREVTRRGEALHLSPKAFQLLETLLEKRPKAVPKEELIERLWPDVVVEEANLKNLVVEIRGVLGQKGLIRTIHRFGYAVADAGSAVKGDEKPVGRLVTRDRLYSLRSGENIIGRGEDCSVFLDAAGVSRRHARINISESCDAQLEDLGSKNGTWLNETRLTQAAPLKAGDRIGIGTIVLIYRPVSREDTTATLEYIRRQLPTKVEE